MSAARRSGKAAGAEVRECENAMRAERFEQPVRFETRSAQERRAVEADRDGRRGDRATRAGQRPPRQRRARSPKHARRHRQVRRKCIDPAGLKDCNVFASRTSNRAISRATATASTRARAGCGRGQGGRR